MIPRPGRSIPMGIPTINRSFHAFFLFAAVITSGCAGQKPLARSEHDRPERVMVVTVAREQAAPVSVRPGFSFGFGFGTGGSGVSTGVGVDVGRDGAAKPAVTFGELDFRAAIQTLYLSSAAAPGQWTWVDGDAADSATLDELVRLNDGKSSKGAATREWMAANRIDKVLVLEPTTWGFQREEGFVVDLRGKLFEIREKPALVWEGRSGRKTPPTGRANDVSEPRRQLMAAATQAIAALTNKLANVR